MVDFSAYLTIGFLQDLFERSTTFMHGVYVGDI